LTHASQRNIRPKENWFLLVLSLSFMLGMVVGLGIYFLWRSNAVPHYLHHLFIVGATIVCPPFILAFAGSQALGSPFTLALLWGTIPLANAFLYAGIAAGVYFAVESVGKRRG
jgi:hypothetical protein